MKRYNSNKVAENVTGVNEGISVTSIKGKTFKATRTTNEGVPTVDDISKMEKGLKDQVDAHNKDFPGDKVTMKEEQTYWSIDDTVILKPVLTKKDVGTIAFRASGDYFYTDSNTKKIFGSKLKKDNIVGNSIVTSHVTYELGDEV
jgi:hypothetical protein